MAELGYPYKPLQVPKDWIPLNGKLPAEVLRPLSGGGTGWFSMEYAGGFVFAANCMYDDARRDGITLRPISEGYRSYERQLALFVDRYQDTPSGRKPEVVRYFEGKKYWLKPNKSPSATPGFSPHGWAVSQDYDVTAGDVFAWLRRNAPAYGIYLQGPPAYLGTGPNPEFEAWHWQLSTPTQPTAMIRRRWRKFVRALG